MTSRRDQLLDSAIAVLGSGGPRRLTHRAVDRAAGLPDGATSNVFRTRSALLGGVLERLLTLEMATWARCLGDEPPRDVETFGRAIAELIDELTGRSATLTRARHALFAEAGTDLELAERVAVQRAELEAVAAEQLRLLGAGEDASHHQGLLALVEGLLWTRTTLPGTHGDPRASIDTYLRGCLLAT